MDGSIVATSHPIASTSVQTDPCSRSCRHESRATQTPGSIPSRTGIVKALTMPSILSARSRARLPYNRRPNCQDFLDSRFLHSILYQRVANCQIGFLAGGKISTIFLIHFVDQPRNRFTFRRARTTFPRCRWSMATDGERHSATRLNDSPQLLASRRLAGGQAEHLLPRRDGLADPARVLEGVAQVEIGGGITSAEPQRLAVRLHGFVVPPGSEQQRPEVVVGRSVGRIVVEERLQRPFRLVGRPVLEEELATDAQGFQVIRTFFDGQVELGPRLVRPARPARPAGS